jgi:hypothetical protein
VPQIAAFAGVVPLEASSAGDVRHGLNQRGNRGLNMLLHLLPSRSNATMLRLRPTWVVDSRKVALRVKPVGHSSGTWSAASGTSGKPAGQVPQRLPGSERPTCFNVGGVRRGQWVARRRTRGACVLVSVRQQADERLAPGTSCDTAGGRLSLLLGFHIASLATKRSKSVLVTVLETPLPTARRHCLCQADHSVALDGSRPLSCSP